MFDDTSELDKTSGYVKLDIESFKALSSETRIDILKALDKKQKTLTDLSKELKMSKATLLVHIEKLLEAGLILKDEEEKRASVVATGPLEMPKQGNPRKWVYYRLSFKGKNLLHPERIRIMLALGTFLLISFALILSYAALSLDDNAGKTGVDGHKAGSGNPEPYYIPTIAVNEGEGPDIGIGLKAGLNANGGGDCLVINSTYWGTASEGNASVLRLSVAIINITSINSSSPEYLRTIYEMNAYWNETVFYSGSNDSVKWNISDSGCCSGNGSGNAGIYGMYAADIVIDNQSFTEQGVPLSMLGVYLPSLDSYAGNYILIDADIAYIDNGSIEPYLHDGSGNGMGAKVDLASEHWKAYYILPSQSSPTVNLSLRPALSEHDGLINNRDVLTIKFNVTFSAAESVPAGDYAATLEELKKQAAELNAADFCVRMFLPKMTDTDVLSGNCSGLSNSGDFGITGTNYVCTATGIAAGYGNESLVIEKLPFFAVEELTVLSITKGEMIFLSDSGIGGQENNTGKITVPVKATLKMPDAQSALLSVRYVNGFPESNPADNTIVINLTRTNECSGATLPEPENNRNPFLLFAGIFTLATVGIATLALWKKRFF